MFYSYMNLIKPQKIVVLFAVLLFSCENYPGKKGDHHFLVTFHVDESIYGVNEWAEPPQFALWLENDSCGEIKTIFVTYRTAKDHWEGKSSCPVSLPFWVGKFKQEYKRDRGPTFTDPLPDAFTGATIQNNFAQKFGVANGKWNCYLEVNVSGDYNSVYKQEFSEEWLHDYGNGQPSIIYCSADILSNDKPRQFKIIGQTDQLNSAGLLMDTMAITSAHKLLQNLTLKRIEK